MVKFFAITFIGAWICFITAGLVTGGEGTAVQGLVVLREFLFLLGAFVPSLVALVLTARADGREGVVILLRKMFAWEVGARWYLFALGFMVVVKLAAALVHRIAFDEWPPFGAEPWYVIAGAMILSTWFQAGEEIGWRGYALPRLAERHGYSRAGVLLGVIWACWHLPLFFVPGIDKTGQSFPVYALQVTALSVAFTWLYVHTHGSLLLVMLMHSAVNQSVGIVPSAVATGTNPFSWSASPVGWLTLGFLWIAAVYFLVRMPRGLQAAPDSIEPRTG